MKLITANSELKSNLSRLIKEYKNISFAVAWASAGTEVFDLLIKNQERIRKAIIGTHFYQTHPDVLDKFTNSNNVRFILQSRGVFHPKIYFFWDEKHWELLIGSANLTAGALKNNTEAMILISSNHSGDLYSSLKKDFLGLIDNYWSEARMVSEDAAASYRAFWVKQRPILQRLSGQYGDITKLSSKTPADSVVMTMLWPQFLNLVKKDPYHGFQKRLDLLNFVRTQFQTTQHFQDMQLGMRKTIAGLPTNFHKNWGWFGSMSGAGYYHQAVNNNNPHISAALDQIPLYGPVLRGHYDAYIQEFIQAFPNGRDGIGIASRLLALKRPDYFVCFDAKNKRTLCQDFGINQTGMNYTRYWEEIIERIQDSVWWNETRPNGTIDGDVWDGRAAMLDAIFYKP